MAIPRLLRHLRALYHGACGRLWFRAGSQQRARHHFELVLALRGDDFGAYVHLGRLAYAAGDYAGWRRELEHARRTNPDRFARLRHPFELFEPRAAGTPFDEAGERATWRAVRPMVPGAIRRSHVHRIELPAESEPMAADGRDSHAELRARDDSSAPMTAAVDDCSSHEERRRFRRLRPITGEELARLDFDELLRRLGS